MKKIGITGGIGSGKTLVSRLFAMMGIPVYYADVAAKDLMHEPGLKSALVAAFGNVYHADGSLDRQLLASMVFNNEKQLQKLNSIVHPKVIENYLTWESRQHAPFLLRESAILFESGTDAGLDEVITVTAPEEIRLKRVMERDNRQEAEIRSIMSRQLSDDEKKRKSRFVIINDDQLAVLPQVWNIYTTLCNG
jgi:dephospho-CoA kinase